MPDKTILRTGRDRLRYSISFEVTLMAMLIPVGAVFFDKPLAEIGLLGVVLSLKAMVMHLVYNWVFDRIDARSARISSERSHVMRVVHAIGFEASLTLTSLPILMIWLKIGMYEALAADIVVTTFIVAYTYVFALAYDKAFPVVRPPVAEAWNKQAIVPAGTAPDRCIRPESGNAGRTDARDDAVAPAPL